MHGHMNVKFSAKMFKRDGIKKKANVTRPARRLLRPRHRGRHHLLLFDSYTVRIWTQMLTVLKPVVIFRTALFWAITQRVVVIPYRRLETSYLSHLKMGADRLSRNVGTKLPLLAA